MLVPHGVHQAGLGGAGGSWYQGSQPTSVLVSLAGCHLPSFSLSPSGLTRSLNRSQEQSYSTGKSPMPPQRPGTQDQTYLDELISIPKGSGVGATRLSQGGRGAGQCCKELEVGRQGATAVGNMCLEHAPSTPDPAQASHSPRLSVSMLKFSRWRNQDNGASATQP